MSRTIQDANLLEWEVFASAADSGFSERPQIVFNCLTNRMLRPRVVELAGDVADAERLIAKGTQADLTALFQRAAPLD